MNETNLSETSANAGPLSGLLVVDFTMYISGPLATVMLADHGARVIKIEPPMGDPLRGIGYTHATHPDLFEEGVSAGFQFYSRGKESVMLDLKKPEDLALAKKLMSKADVVFENFRPGVMKKLGLDYDSARAVNPGLVYVSVSGYGQSGQFAKNPAFDVIVQATSGFMASTGFPGGRPTKSGGAIADAGAAVNAYAACLTALYGREKTGKGCHIDVAMQDALMIQQGDQFIESFVSGKHPGLAGNEVAQLHPFGVFPCKDDTQLALCIATPDQFATMATAMGHPEWAEDSRFRFPVPLATTHREDFDAVFLPELAKKTSMEWKAIFEAVRLPVNMLYDFVQIGNAEFFKQRKMVIDYKGTKVLGNPLKLSAYPDPGDSLRRAPTLGEQADAIKKEFG